MQASCHTHALHYSGHENSAKMTHSRIALIKCVQSATPVRAFSGMLYRCHDGCCITTCDTRHQRGECLADRGGDADSFAARHRQEWRYASLRASKLARETAVRCVPDGVQVQLGWRSTSFLPCLHGRLERDASNEHFILLSVCSVCWWQQSLGGPQLL
jgi:hypothetical protein